MHKEPEKNILKVSGDGPEPLRVTVKNEKTGEVIYDDVSIGGVLVSCENLKIKGDEMDGQTQKYMWGHPLKWIFCADQLFQNLKNEMPKTMEAILTELHKQGLSEREEQLLRKAMAKWQK